MPILKPKSICCDYMKRQLDWSCTEHEEPYECPDALINYDEVFDEYGLIIHDGGSSSITIYHCPWCGKKLPDSKRNRWFEELEKLGVKDISIFDNDNIPEKYQTGEWYQE